AGTNIGIFSRQGADDFLEDSETFLSLAASEVERRQQTNHVSARGNRQQARVVEAGHELQRWRLAVARQSRDVRAEFDAEHETKPPRGSDNVRKSPRQGDQFVLEKTAHGARVGREIFP